MLMYLQQQLVKLDLQVQTNKIELKVNIFNGKFGVIHSFSNDRNKSYSALMLRD